jgi:hypothetical protein
MHVTELAINSAMGMRLAPAGRDHILELPESALLINHVSTIYASVQFALAEAGSGEFLLRQLGEAQGQVLAALRASTVKFRKPAHGELRANAQFADTDAAQLSAALVSRGCALVAVLVEVADAQGAVTLCCQGVQVVCARVARRPRFACATISIGAGSRSDQFFTHGETRK